MKKILGAIVVLIALYTGAWYYKGSEIKEKALSEIAQANQSTKNPYVFTYSKASLSGYPFGFAIDLDNPQLRAKDPANESKVPLRKLGDLTVGTNLIGSKIWIEARGATDLDFNIMKKGEAAFRGNVQFDEAEFVLSFKDNWHFLSLPRKRLKELWQESWDVYVESRNFQLRDQTTPQQFYLSQKDGYITASHTTSAGEKEARIEFDVDFNDYKLIAEGGIEPKTKRDLLLLMNLKSNFPSLLTGETSDLALHFDIATSDMKALMDMDPKKFKDLDYANIDLTLAFNTTEGRRLDAKYDLDFNRKNEEAFDFDFYQKSTYQGFKGYLVTMLEEYEKDVQKLIGFSEDPQEKKNLQTLSKVLKTFSESNVVEKLGGELATEIDFSVDSVQSGENIEILVNLPTFYYSFPPYKVNMSLNGRLLPMFWSGLETTPLKDGYVNLEIDNYQDLIDDFSILVWEINNLKQNGSNTDRLSRSDVKAIGENVITFLKSISNNPQEDSENLAVTIEAKDLTNIKIGTLTPVQVAVEYNKMVEENRKYLPETKEETTEK